MYTQNTKARQQNGEGSVTPYNTNKMIQHLTQRKPREHFWICFQNGKFVFHLPHLVGTKEGRKIPSDVQQIKISCKV